MCDRFRDALGSGPTWSAQRPTCGSICSWREDKGTLYLDTSGEPLFKRGWRAGQGEAPLRENLAAGIVMLTRWRSDEPLLDPMCGGGTLLVEAAAMARGRAPGAKRSFWLREAEELQGSTVGEVKNGENMPDDSIPSCMAVITTPKH